jgi:DNA-binding response OmpR family regulator
MAIFNEKLPTLNSNPVRNPAFILLVEDDRGDAFLARRTVYNTAEKGSRYDYFIDHAASLSEALDSLATEKYSAVLLDLSLTDADGTEGVNAIKSAFPSMPIIVLTNNEDRHTKLNATVSGATSYLLKRHLKTDPKRVAEALDDVLSKP